MKFYIWNCKEIMYDVSNCHYNFPVSFSTVFAYSKVS